MDQRDPQQDVAQSSVQQEVSTPNVDKLYIAEKLGVESNSLEKLDDNILLKIKVNLDEFDSMKSQNMVLEMNLEQLKHLSNKKVEIMKNKINKLTSEKSSLEESLSLAKETQLKHEAEISKLEIERNATSKLLEENKELIATVEKDKTHSFEIIKRREDENKSLRDELQQLSKNNKELRNELVNLETLTQRSSSELLKLKFDKSNLIQELEILKKNSSWYETELNKKMEELKTFKVDKYKEFSSLQSDLDSSKSQLQSITYKYENLKQNYDSTSKRLDDSLIEIKNLTDKIAYNKEDFLKEMTSKDKLIEILNKSNEDRKERVETLQSALDSIKNEDIQSSSDLQIQLDKANKNLQNSSFKIQQLESTIDDLLSTNGAINGANYDASVISQMGSVPSTPRMLKQFQQGEFPLSPSAQQTLSKIGGGISLTQLYSDFQLMKKQLIKERRLKENLERQVNQFVEELNKQVPAISATRERCSVLELELTDISIVLEKTSKDKETLLRENKNWSKKLNEYELELSTLNKSRVDLSRQIAHLMIQLSLKLEGDAPLTQQEKEVIDKLVGNNVNGYDDESDTDKLITERLVKFKSVVELTAKNEELLKITRQLGNQLENQEKLNHEKINNLESVAIDEAREAIIVLQEQITSLEGKLNSVTRERDMFRSISAGHKQVDVFNSTPNSTALDIKDSSEKQASLESQILQVEEEYKTYKKETESKIIILNKQINELKNSKSELTVQLAKATSSSQLFEERYKSAQETLKYSKSETEEIRKRSNMLQDSLSKHDLANQQLTEELIQTRSLSQSLNLEISNLKLEKQLWKSIEKRLNEENANLLDERLRLNTLTGDLQRLENERDKSFNESTSRLNITISSLEEELSSLKSKLEINTEELRSALLRKDSDAKAYQERIESLRDELSSAREDIINRRRLADQLEQTIQSLKKQLLDTEQQLRLYESTDEIDSEDNIEVKLRQDLQKTKIELENTVNDLNASNESIEQFKSVANAAESSLAELTSSYDEYRKSVESKLVESNEMNENLVKQITELNNNISELQEEIATSKTENEKNVVSLNNEIEALRIKASSADEIRAEYEQRMDLIKKDLEQQSNIANESQKSYEEELQKHAEVSKLNIKLREEESLLKIKIQELTIESRDTKTALVSSQESWENQKLTLEEELKIAESRVGDLNLQNRMLLNQLEQITKQQKESVAENSEHTNVSYSSGSSEELLQVVSFLRHEKEISDSQLDVSKQEQKRLQQNLEITRQDLEDTKLELSKLHAKEQHSVKLELDYRALTEKINQLDILRESNNTLRQECHKYSSQVKTLEEKLSANIAKLEPLEFEVVNLKLELETKNKELVSEKSIVEFWKNKNQEILQNYNRIDPTEYNDLKLKVEELTPYVEQVELLNKKLTDLEQGYQAERKKSIREANDRLTKFKGIIDVTKKELTEEKQKSTDLQEELEALQKKLEDASESVKETSNNNHSQEFIDSLQKEVEETKLLLKQANEDRDQKLLDIQASRDLLQKQVDELQIKIDSSNTAEIGNNNDINIDALKAELEKEKLEFIKQKNDELEQQKFKLRVEIKKELEEQAAANASTAAAAPLEGSVDIESLKKQLEAEHAKDVELKVKKACDELKAKIREPHEAKINGIVNKRFEKLKQEAEIEIKKKEEELAKSYESKLKEASNNEALQEEILKLKESIEAECKKAKEEGRSSALKEGEMRYKMTKRQLDKAKAELETLKGKESISSALQSAPTLITPSEQNSISGIPVKPVVGTPTNNNSGSRIPTHNFRENLKKPQILKPQQDEEVKGVKRAADENGSEDIAEKKSKNE